MVISNEQWNEVLPHLKRFAHFLARDTDKAEDLLQDTVERAIMKSYLLDEGTSLRAWTFTIMRNIFVNQVRHRQVVNNYVRYRQAMDTERQEAVQEDTILLQRALKELEEAKDRHLAKSEHEENLTAEEADAIRRLGLDGNSYSLVAEMTQLPIGTLKSRLSRGRKKLRRAILAEVTPA